MSFLVLSGLTKRYGSSTVVNDISLSIDKGKLVCLLGPSGCGKTTTLRLIAGFVEPDGGEIHVNGRRVSACGATRPPEHRNMSMIFQSYALWPHMTIFENVAYGLELRKMKGPEIRRRTEQILEVTRLIQFSQRYPGELSGGQQQRVALARALVIEPEILLLDEPLSNLDANLREEMRFEIRRLHDEYQYTTVYVTHDQSEAMTTADQIVVMNQGIIEQMGTPKDIYGKPQSEFVARFIGGANIFKGKWDGDASVDADGLVLRCGSGSFARDGETAVSIRHYDTRILPAPSAAAEPNRTRGTIVRQSYLGQYHDYQVMLASGKTLRVSTPSDMQMENGSEVGLYFPPEHCRAMRQ
ncbi:ABC transporter ATP-binding protein [Pollutimonas bauzanensis]|uniref:Iron(III) transport system ATP-binding protein n=1 Tax=Pollutimonas bauzanensis TaxID=658167 RepID=A0A1M5X9R7_9BURK|nr:ABC transporter ATP-binding protein [Pollutimonas bauzanensis]SHH96274.1 iron(III) transport system ATP-binding protein [Pollutimonas bauzanensis]